MCLTNITTKEPLIADKDIIVYKHITRFGETFKTSYRYSPVIIGEEYKSKLKKYINNESKLDIGLHSYCNEDDARVGAERYEEVLVECLIPKGSKYYKGLFCFKEECYASNKLRYVKILKDYSK